MENIYECFETIRNRGVTVLLVVLRSLVRCSLAACRFLVCVPSLLRSTSVGNSPTRSDHQKPLLDKPDSATLRAMRSQSTRVLGVSRGVNVAIAMPARLFV